MIATIRRTFQVTLKKAAVERLSAAEKDGLCVACMKPLDSTRTVRGCHERCLKATTRAIAQGLCTEEQRISEGKLLTADPGGRRPSNPVTVELRQES